MVGRVAVIVVPSGVVSMVALPPISSARSTSEASPVPGTTPAANPAPSSATVTVSSAGPAVKATRTWRARACRTAFVIASAAMRYAAVSTAGAGGGSGVTGSSTTTSTASVVSRRASSLVASNRPRSTRRAGVSPAVMRRISASASPSTSAAARSCAPAAPSDPAGPAELPNSRPPPSTGPGKPPASAGHAHPGPPEAGEAPSRAAPPDAATSAMHAWAVPRRSCTAASCGPRPSWISLRSRRRSSSRASTRRSRAICASSPRRRAASAGLAWSARSDSSSPSRSSGVLAPSLDASRRPTTCPWWRRRKT